MVEAMLIVASGTLVLGAIGVLLAVLGLLFGVMHEAAALLSGR